jgi:hypothetical protein
MPALKVGGRSEAQVAAETDKVIQVMAVSDDRLGRTIPVMAQLE